MTFPDGFQTDLGFDPAEDYMGPFYYKELEDQFLCAFVSESKHCNTTGIVHGGVLMTFADFSLCLAATDHYKEENCITVSFSAEFVSGAEIGTLVECIPRVVRKTGSMAFITGEVTSAGLTVMTFGSVVKRLREQ